MAWSAAVRAASLVLYPLAVYFALEYVEVRYLGIALLVVLLLRHRRQARTFMAGLEWAGPALISIVGVFAALVWWTNNELLLRLYPALLNAVTLSLFAFTIYRPPSMIERFARLEQPELPPDGVRYTKRLTWVWCGFLTANGSIAVYTALFMSREAWALYNGLIAYILMGALLLGERVFRRYWLARGNTS
ncbi:MAG: hypothetical protein HY308_06575 [Gammaproteobacteria bacterium]|nr:hypothetical protein [Gammaproteobacteria bacterium]